MKLGLLLFVWIDSDGCCVNTSTSFNKAAIIKKICQKYYYICTFKILNHSLNNIFSKKIRFSVKNSIDIIQEIMVFQYFNIFFITFYLQKKKTIGKSDDCITRFGLGDTILC